MRFFRHGKNIRRWRPDFCCFAGVFEGGFRKHRGWRWYFDGEIVVECVIKRGELTSLRGG
jgi:hypothetical protein